MFREFQPTGRSRPDHSINYIARDRALVTYLGAIAAARANDFMLRAFRAINICQ